MMKGTLSIRIAKVFVALQVLFILGTLGAGPSPSGWKNVSFHNLPAIIQSITVLLGVNIIGIGALILSLIAWKYHRNICGKNTAIISVVVIMVNTLLVIVY